VGAIRRDHLPESLTVRWVGRRRILMEEAPQFHRYLFREHMYYLPFPWLYYLFGHTKERSRVGRSYLEMEALVARPSRATSLEDPVSRLPLPNFVPYTIGRPCMGINAWCEYLDEGINDTYLNWWSSNGNHDYWPTTPVWRKLNEAANGPPEKAWGGWDTPPRILKTFEYWETLSLDDVLSWSWPKCSTIRNVCRSRAQKLPSLAQKAS
jgi:hypothetical protein